jgi:hypothetical protein
MSIDYKADYLESIGAADSENEQPVVEVEEEKIDYAADFLETQEQAAVVLANNKAEEAPTAFDRIFMEPLGSARSFWWYKTKHGTNRKHGLY